MTEPLFFDCLTDAQVWSLFDSGVLQSSMLPLRVYERLERIAPDHGCYLFTCPAGVAPPSLQEIAAEVALALQEPSPQPHSRRVDTPLTPEQICRAMAALCARLPNAMPHAGRRVHVVATQPRPALRVGPRLEPPAHDLHAMSLPELEAYLDDVLRLDEDDEVALHPPAAAPLSEHSEPRSTSLDASQGARYTAQAPQTRSD